MKDFQVDHRRGHRGVCSRDDWSRVYKADTIADVVCDLTPEYDIDHTEEMEKFTVAYCSDNGGSWEHYFIITEIKE